MNRLPCTRSSHHDGVDNRHAYNVAGVQANRAKDAILSDLKASLASADDLDKVPAMLEEMQRRHEATGAALSDHISMHCAQLRAGLEDMATALSETEAIKQRLREVRELCKKADVLGATEARHAGVMATVQVLASLFLPSMPLALAERLSGRCEQATGAFHSFHPSPSVCVMLKEAEGASCRDSPPIMVQHPPRSWSALHSSVWVSVPAKHILCAGKH